MKNRLLFVLFYILFLSPSANAFFEENDLDPWSVSDKNPIIEEKSSISKSNPYIIKSSPGISLIWLIGMYKLTSSSAGSCTFHPTCSQYTRQAIIKHGFLIGLMIGAERIMRYHHDFSHYDPIDIGGAVKLYDPVENNDFWF